MDKMTSPRHPALVAYPLDKFPFLFDDSPITEGQATDLIRMGLRHRVFRRELSSRTV